MPRLERAQSTTVLATESAAGRTRDRRQGSNPQNRADVPDHGGGSRDLGDGIRTAMPHGDQLVDREVQADPEHQEDDADLGQLLR